MNKKKKRKKALHIDAFLHPCLNCLLKSRHSLYHVWRENSKDHLCPQGFQDGKEIYIYIHDHRILWWVLWACNLCINSGGFSREKMLALNFGDWIEFFR